MENLKTIYKNQFLDILEDKLKELYSIKHLKGDIKHSILEEEIDDCKIILNSFKDQDFISIVNNIKYETTSTKIYNLCDDILKNNKL